MNQAPYRVLIVNERELGERTTGDSVHQYEFFRALSRAATRNKGTAPDIVVLSCGDLVGDDVRRLVRTAEFKHTPYVVLLVARLLMEIKRSSVVYTREFNPVVAILTRILGRPLVVEANGLWSQEFSLLSRNTLLARCWAAWLRLDEMIAFNFASSVIAVTPYLRNAIVEDYDLEPQLVQFVPNAVDCDRFRPEKHPPHAFASEQKLTVTTQASFKVWHGADDLAKIASELSKRAMTARFFLVGSGPALSGVLALARELGVGGTFVSLGSIPNERMPEVLRQTDLCVYTPRTSKYRMRVGEYTLKVLEWMAAGKPIISYSIPGIDDLLGQGAGILVPPGDVTGVVDGIMYLVQNPAFRENLATEARRRACDHYDWKKVVDRILGIIDDARTKKSKAQLLPLFLWFFLLVPEMAAITARRHLRGTRTFKL